jgi:hypothetical protein
MEILMIEFKLTITDTLLGTKVDFAKRGFAFSTREALVADSCEYAITTMIEMLKETVGGVDCSKKSEEVVKKHELAINESANSAPIMEWVQDEINKLKGESL